MSIKHIDLAFATEGLDPHEKLVLVCIANFANEEGVAYPDMQTVQKQCSLSKNGMRLITSRLEDLGHLSVKRRHGNNGRTVWTMFPDQDFNLKNASPEPHVGLSQSPTQGFTRGPEENGKASPRVPRRASPESHVGLSQSLTYNDEPSVNRQLTTTTDSISTNLKSSSCSHAKTDDGRQNSIEKENLSEPRKGRNKSLPLPVDVEESARPVFEALLEALGLTDSWRAGFVRDDKYRQLQRLLLSHLELGTTPEQIANVALRFPTLFGKTSADCDPPTIRQWQEQFGRLSRRVSSEPAVATPNLTSSANAPAIDPDYQRTLENMNRRQAQAQQRSGGSARYSTSQRQGGNHVAHTATSNRH